MDVVHTAGFPLSAWYCNALASYGERLAVLGDACVQAVSLDHQGTHVLLDGVADYDPVVHASSHDNRIYVVGFRIISPAEDAPPFAVVVTDVCNGVVVETFHMNVMPKDMAVSTFVRKGRPVHVVACCGADGVASWTVDGVSVVKSYVQATEDHSVAVVAFSPFGELAVVNVVGEILVYPPPSFDDDSGKALFVGANTDPKRVDYIEKLERATCVEFSHNSDILAVACWDCSVRIYLRTTELGVSSWAHLASYSSMAPSSTLTSERCLVAWLRGCPTTGPLLAVGDHRTSRLSIVALQPGATRRVASFGLSCPPKGLVAIGGFDLYVLLRDGSVCRAARTVHLSAHGQVTTWDCERAWCSWEHTSALVDISFLDRPLRRPGLSSESESKNEALCCLGRRVFVLAAEELVYVWTKGADPKKTAAEDDEEAAAAAAKEEEGAAVEGEEEAADEKEAAAAAEGEDADDDDEGEDAAASAEGEDDDDDDEEKDATEAVGSFWRAACLSSPATAICCIATDHDDILLACVEERRLLFVSCATVAVLGSVDIGVAAHGQVSMAAEWRDGTFSVAVVASESRTVNVHCIQLDAALQVTERRDSPPMDINTFDLCAVRGAQLLLASVSGEYALLHTEDWTLRPLPDDIRPDSHSTTTHLMALMRRL